MALPAIFQSGYSMILYLILAYVLGMGLWQFIQGKTGNPIQVKTLMPLGGMAVVVGVIGLLQHYRLAFEAIEAAGDISPSIVAGAMKGAFGYPTLGLLCLAVAFLFRYLNQVPAARSSNENP